MTSTKRKKKSSKRTAKRKRSSEPAARTVYLGLGSNLGDERAQLAAALGELSRIARIVRVSSFYRTDPVGYEAQPPFVNAVVEVAWRGTPRALLGAVRSIERRIGRTPSFRDGPREIDIDILDFAGQVRSSRDLALPHPRLALRRFVLVPLAEIAPEWRHPVSGRSARELLRSLPEKPGVRRLSAFGGHPERSEGSWPRQDNGPAT
jgi:2-amino-4-hydroxy-6-hydroxymethyldihydropteridine diphosphokinase